MKDSELGDRIKLLLALLVLAPLAWCYVSIPQTTENSFLLLVANIIPSLCAVLVGIPVLYFLTEYLGLKKLYNNEEIKVLRNIQSNIELLREDFDSKMSKLELITSFEEEFYGCDWQGLIAGSNCHIDIVVYYFDSWINRYRNELIEYFRKPETTITIIVCDPDINNNLEQISRLYPNNSEEILRAKIIQTYDKINAIAEEAGANKSRIEFYNYPYLLNYSIQKFDNSRAIISLFEMFRHNSLKAPTFELNLDKSAKLKNFFDKEITGLIKDSAKSIKKK